MGEYQIIQIREDTWRIEDRGVRFFLLTGTEKALLVDSSMTLPNAREIAETLTDLPIELLNTHGDGDHVAGNGGFDWFYMHPSECANYYRSGRGGSFRPVYHGDVLDLGGRELEIIALPGHTPGSITLLDRKYRTLVGGDPVQDGSIFMFGPYREMHAYIESLKILQKRETEFDEIYPSHGSLPVCPELIGKLIDGAKKVLAGETEPQEINMYGTAVMKHDVGCAAFLCEK